MFQWTVTNTYTQVPNTMSHGTGVSSFGNLCPDTQNRAKCGGWPLFWTWSLPSQDYGTISMKLNGLEIDQAQPTLVAEKFDID